MRNYLDERNQGVLRIEILRNGEIREFVALFQALENLYNHLYALGLIEQAAKESVDSYSWKPKPVRTLRTIRYPNDVVLPEDRLRLFRISVSSPGWLDALGKLAPLETIRNYLSDRHERYKDHTYRIATDQEKLGLANERQSLENEKLKTEVMQSRIQMLKDLGVPEDKIRQATMNHFVKPVEQLDILQDVQLIGGAKMLSQSEANANQEDTQ